MGRVYEIVFLDNNDNYAKREGQDRYLVKAVVNPNDFGTKEAARRIVDQANNAGADLPHSDKVYDFIKNLRPGQSVKFRAD